MWVCEIENSEERIKKGGLALSSVKMEKARSNKRWNAWNKFTYTKKFQRDMGL